MINKFKKIIISSISAFAVFGMSTGIGFATANWDKSSLVFTDRGGDCKEIYAEVKNGQGSEPMDGEVKYEVYWAETGNPKKGEIVATSTIPALKSGEAYKLTYQPTSNEKGPEGNYMFKAYQRPGHPGKGELWSEQISVTEGCKPTEEPPAEKPEEPGEKPEEPGKEEPKPPGEKPEEPGKEEPKPQPCPVDPSPEDFHDITVDTGQAANGKVTVTAKLDGKEADGTWYIAAGKESSDQPAIFDEVKNVKKTTFTYDLDINKLPVGENVIFVSFEGTVDGKNCQFGFGGTGIIVEDDTVKPNPEEKPQKPSTPEKGKETADKIKGGKLPKTATSYPIAMTLGGFLLLAGFGLFLFRRTA